MGLRIEGSFDFSALNDKIHAAAIPALESGADVVKDDAVEKVPHESGDLAGTARVRPDRGGDNTVAITFDGPYAQYIHEGVEFHHPHGGQAKYLEMALVEKSDEALIKTADKLREAL